MSSFNHMEGLEYILFLYTQNKGVLNQEWEKYSHILLNLTKKPPQLPSPKWPIKTSIYWIYSLRLKGCWRRLLRVPWTARRSNQSILKEISPGCSLEGLMLKLKLQYFGHWCKELTHWKRPWCWERLRTGGEEDDRGWDGWMVSLT